MGIVMKHIILAAVMLTIKPNITESQDEYIHKIEAPFYHSSIYTNICDIIDRRSKIHCYCDSTKLKYARRADCWVFTEISEDDPIWASFSSQPELEHLIFNVRADDALRFIPAKAIIRLDKLKHISIQFGNISKITPYAFTNSSTIKQITLKSNKIERLEKHCFSQMMMLSNLSLDDNQISELNRDVFFNLPNLHILNLSNNNLSIIHERSFKHLNNLIELRLDFNYITVLSREMMDGLGNLLRLNLRNNKLSMIGNLAFSDLWGLKELMLDHNIIEFISDRAFSGLTQLRKLTLSGNKLTVFYEDLLEDTRSLVLLDLRENLLETISYESVRPVVENKKSASTAIYFDGNPLHCDCRLTWIYILRNKTKNNTLRRTLQQVSCVTDEDTIVKENFTSDSLADESYEYYDQNERNHLYKSHSYNTAVKLIDIPLENLPCPAEIMQTMEETYGHPIQNEIRLKSFAKFVSISRSLFSISTLLLLLL